MGEAVSALKALTKEKKDIIDAVVDAADADKVKEQQDAVNKIKELKAAATDAASKLATAQKTFEEGERRLNKEAKKYTGELKNLQKTMIDDEEEAQHYLEFGLAAVCD